MALLRYLQLDVFASRPGTGNPLGALLDADALSGEQMQALAAWLNLSETVFFLRPSAPGADYHIRIFTPTRELAFAGHPSVGAAWAMALWLVAYAVERFQQARRAPLQDEPAPAAI